jgi:arylsulfatase A-like enzyme
MNILFITADQWRAECLSALDHPVVKTPNIDALANDGLLFQNHYAQATPCSPSRTSLHTGLYLHNHRVCQNGTPYDDRHTNWAVEVRKAGYAPYLFGYTDTAADPRGMDPDDPRLKHYSEPLRGIETDTVYYRKAPLNWVSHLRNKGYSIPEDPWDLYQIEKEGIQWEHGGETPLPSFIAHEDHETHFFVDCCIDWIATRKAPWISHLSLVRPHPPFVAPEPYNAEYDPSVLDPFSRAATPEQEGEQHPWLAWQLGLEKYRAPDDLAMLNRLKASYYGLMREVDDNLGRLFDALRRLGQWGDTMIIFTSDHGEQMGDHWLMSKSGYFNESYHIPLIIRDPRSQADVTRGKRIVQFTENVDIMPTMLDWLGLEIPNQCDGDSLMPLITRKSPPSGWRNEVHWHFDFRNPLDSAVEDALGITQHQCALNVIRDESYKYVHFTALPPLFFDLNEDPGEFNNCAHNPDYQGLVLHYAQKLISWRMNHEDRALTETCLSLDGPVTRHSPRRHI